MTPPKSKIRRFATHRNIFLLISLTGIGYLREIHQRKYIFKGSNLVFYGEALLVKLHKKKNLANKK